MEYILVENNFATAIKNDTGADIPSGNQKYYLKNLSFLNDFNVINIRVYDRGTLGPGVNKNVNGITVGIITASRMSLYLNLVNQKDQIIIQNFPLAILTGNNEGDQKKLYQFNLNKINWEKCFISGTPQSYAWLVDGGFVIQFGYKK